MKGVIFVLFEEFVEATWGDEAFELLLDECPEFASEPLVAPATYPDAWIVQLLTAACRHFQLEPAAALRAFGRFCFGGLARRYPSLLTGATAPREFLLSVHDIIHVEVKKLMAEARPPVLRYEPGVDGSVRVHYESERGLCALMSGLLDGLGEHFQAAVEHEHVACRHRGDSACTFAVRFPVAVPSP